RVDQSSCGEVSKYPVWRGRVDQSSCGEVRNSENPPLQDLTYPVGAKNWSPLSYRFNRQLSCAG
ncbi:hypothetical protein, partial [Limnospira sp. PMC 1252.20]